MPDRSWAIAVHGGAKEIAPDEAAALSAGCRLALSAGAAVLERSGAAIQAVEAAIRVLEADPAFNAGLGSVVNSQGKVEMDAGLMDGADLRVGAVAALSGVKHPISVARLLVAAQPVLLAGDGARLFAAENGAELCDPASLRPARQPSVKHRGCDTVGCVALDTSGNIAAGNSTGGLDGKLPGRVGDSPLPGCGFYADSAVGGVALSGEGEAIIRTMLAARIMQAMTSCDAQDAVKASMAVLKRVQGEAGAIAIDRQGRLGWFHNSPHFAVGLAASDMPVRVYLAKAEEQDV
jgi:beta-aspartyl-peptidase (threonine type)